MGIKTENTQRIRELEEEFSDEKLESYFRVEDENAENAAESARHDRGPIGHVTILVVVLAVCAAGSFIYLITMG